MIASQAVAIIGCGNMGGRIGRRLVDAGIRLTGFDLRAEQVTEIGATPADSIAAAAKSADLILLSLPDSNVVENVLRTGRPHRGGGPSSAQHSWL